MFRPARILSAFFVSVLTSFAGASCYTAQVPPGGPCGTEPGLAACADGVPPACECVTAADGTSRWSCAVCSENVDCRAHPEAEACKRPDVCGEAPELPYVCSGGTPPKCTCSVDGQGRASWHCEECPPIDCAATPNEAVCNKDGSCIRCHGLATGAGTPGIENAHPWLYLGCTECHGGRGVDSADPTRALSKEESHVHIPAEMAQDGSVSTPKRTSYRNHYLGRAGVESLTGGREWIRFMNPGDLRIVDDTCGTCHAKAGEYARRSVMSTLVGKYDAMLYAAGVPREPRLAAKMGGGVSAKKGATYSAIAVHDTTFDAAHAAPGQVEELVALTTKDRETEIPYGTFTEEHIIKETMNKACGNCHLNNNGANDKYGVFRTSGCSACHMPYDYSGKSSSGDPMIPKEEPTYPAAYGEIQYPQRPHPIKHQLTRVPEAQDCLSCHTGSARVVFQYWGIRTDDNRDLKRAKDSGANINFRYAELIDNQREPAARLHGFTQDQLIEYEDLNDDGQDDTPPDVHHEAGMDCIDCHVATEMHGDGKIYSRQNQATVVRCNHCHGNLEVSADANDTKNPINQLFQMSGNPARKYLWKFDRVPGYGEGGYPYVKQPGVWLKTKSKGEWKYVPQVAWGVKWDPTSQECFGEGRNTDPRTGGFVCNPLSSVAHGRWNGLNAASGDLEDGVGSRPSVDVVTAGDGTTNPRFGFSHLGERAVDGTEVVAAGIECSTCHAAWNNMRYGNHLGIVDTDGTNRFYDWDRVTGQMTLGKQGWFNFTYVDMLTQQLSIGPKGKISWMIPARLKMFMRATVLKNNAPFEFMTQVGDPGHVWKTYRDRLGYGNLLSGAGGLTNAPGWASVCLETGGVCDADPKKNINGGLGIDTMEPHSIRRRARDCQSCHLGPNGEGAGRIAAVYGWNPRGFDTTTSAYLNKVRQVVAPHGTYSTEKGFVIADDGVEHRLDHLVDEATGYPLVYTIHPRTDDGRDGRPKRGYSTYVQESSGPIGKDLIDKLGRIRVRNAQQ